MDHPQYDAATMVAYSKKNAVNGMEHFLKVFSFVPDERLLWTPVLGTKSALRIAAHTAVCAGNFAGMMRNRALPTGDEIPAFVARMKAAEEAVGDRADAEVLFRRNTDDVLSALDGLSPEEVSMTLDSGLGWTAPMTWLMNLPHVHAETHTSQIDYLQTCWGDHTVHF